MQNSNADTICPIKCFIHVHSVHGARQKHDVWIGIHSRCKLSIEMADMVKSWKHNGKHALPVKPLLFKAFHSYLHRHSQFACPRLKMRSLITDIEMEQK